MKNYCIRCDAEITFIEDRPSMPREAILMFSSGNYGSRVWDEMYRTILIYLCDDCLVTQKERIREQRLAPRPDPEIIDWEPPE